MLVTGATSGIGRSLAEAFHDLGNTVIVTGRRAALLDQMVTERPALVARVLDLDDPADVKRFAALITSEFPALNVLVNNAGISRAETLHTGTPDGDIAHAILRTNVGAVLDLTLALLPHLRRQSDACIVTTTSGLAFVPRSAYPTYCASKAFLHSWLQSLRHQLRGSVEVLELVPPYVQTELAGAAQAIDPAAMPLADYVAEVMEILVTKRFSHGEILVERVRRLRQAESEGTYRQMFGALNPT
jgi:uncharacterized oxidoreductase